MSFEKLVRGAKRAGRVSARARRLSVRPCAFESLEVRRLLAVSVLNNSGQGYAGLSFNQSGGYVPPDTNGAAGPSAYVETVNQSVALYGSKGTGAGAVTDSLSHFFFATGGLNRTDSGSGQSDPVVTYDEQIGRFIIGDQDVDFSTHASSFDLAVSKTNNPTTLSASDWTFYKIDTTETGFDADYPGNLGYNHDALVFSLNMFGVTGGGHAQIVSVNATDLMNGSSSPQIVRNDLNDFSVRPTAMHDSVAGDPMWLVTEHGDNRSIDVIKMAGVLTSSPSFSYTNLPVTSYSPVVDPLNPNGTVITSNIDSRIQKAAEANDTIVAAHTVGASSTQDVAQWYAIDVSSGTPTLAQQGRVGAGPNTYVTYPGIDINPSGQIGMSFMQSGTDSSTDFMSMWVTGRTSTDAAGAMEPPVLVPAGAGQANYSDFTSGGRAGDLSGINVDPVDGTFWAANEFANRQNTANWGTAIANFAPAAPANSADLAVTVSGPASVTAGANATYTITLNNNGPNAAQGVVLSDVLPTGATLVSMTQATGSDGFTLAQSGGTLTETATGNIASGSSDTFTLIVTASASLTPGADFSDTASVSASSADPNTANNTATASGSIVGADADLAVTIGPASAAAAPLVEGGDFSYTITVTNNGPNSATDVVLSDALDSDTQFISAQFGGNGTGTVTQSGGVLTVDLGTIAAGASVTLTVTDAALEDATLTNSATVTTSSNDTDASNNSASVSISAGEPSIIVSAPVTTTSSRLKNFTAATFTHAGGLESPSAFTATIDWGDGTTSTGQITLSGTTYTVTGSHNYKNPGQQVQAPGNGKGNGGGGGGGGGGGYTITTYVTELSTAAQLLLAKIGDEVPGLPDRIGPGSNPGNGNAAGGASGNGFDPRGLLADGPTDEFYTELAAWIAAEANPRAATPPLADLAMPEIVGTGDDSPLD